MMDKQVASHESSPSSPHVIMFPFPVPSHIHSMLNLAQIFCEAHLSVTFVMTVHARNAFSGFSDLESQFSHHAAGKIRFEYISDGLPDEHPRGVTELLGSLAATATPLLKEMVQKEEEGAAAAAPRCVVVADALLSFGVEMAEELGVPIFQFHCISASANWTCSSLPRLIRAGELPLKGRDMDMPITSVKSMEGFLRYRDLPAVFRVDDVHNDPTLQIFHQLPRNYTQSKHHIINTFHDLERPILDQMPTIMSNVYAIGPLHEFLAANGGSSNVIISDDDNTKSCLDCLDNQPAKSVLYVSFGTLSMVSRETLVEFWHGLVNSGQRFLWSLNSNLVTGREIPAEILTGSREMTCVVEWAPQRVVLGHFAVAGFLTHCRWNSILESIVAGVPMIGWPIYGEQQVNSRYVAEVWKVGLDMKDTCHRVIIEKMVRELMEERKDEFLKRAPHYSKLAKQSVRQGGSSSSNLEHLLEDIRRI
ncbi:7-deoxyloganetic acid glucosyltransferase-like [Ipomoea triloba]|uniref:7-deoxyloganetic acid glucosyltransferase-like n=1 Tax=Ipomoea triloba TaxID=35885 RepID=UPI00125DB18D|nr:7-deoxyloganetic acid glucosyltransferase-like [Ipomoea triloba]